MVNFTNHQDFYDDYLDKKSRPRKSDIGQLLANVSKQAIKGIAGIAIIASASLFIFWDFDFYSVRDKWENFKIAMLDEWTQDGWCPPGNASKLCDEVNRFKQAFAGTTGITFFREKPIEGTALNVTTGVRYENVDKIFEKKPIEHWCYIAVARGDSNLESLSLGLQKGNFSPEYTHPSKFTPDDAALTGLPATRMTAIALTHCQFGSTKSKGEV